MGGKKGGGGKPDNVSVSSTAAEVASQSAETSTDGSWEDVLSQHCTWTCSSAPSSPCDTSSIANSSVADSSVNPWADMVAEQDDSSLNDLTGNPWPSWAEIQNPVPSDNALDEDSDSENPCLLIDQIAMANMPAAATAGAVAIPTEVSDSDNPWAAIPMWQHLQWQQQQQPQHLAPSDDEPEEHSHSEIPTEDSDEDSDSENPTQPQHLAPSDDAPEEHSQQQQPQHPDLSNVAPLAGHSIGLPALGMPGNADEAIVWCEYLPPPLAIMTLSDADRTAVMNALRRANLWGDMPLLDYAAMFGIPSAENPWGDLVDFGMIWLVARYLIKSRHAWHLEQCGPIRFGWWLLPNNWSAHMSVTAPSTGDTLWYPCVWFWLGGRWWQICLHLLWRLCKAWCSHRDRFVPWI